ncbi:uncharacterized protein TM35_000352110 [Trypanosoma theileri]|uniref:Uncharacterized protein n=1 Tax=Trypanosoma theileri TaxID=67003 RepID=A0A1X0NLE9_9TRYP|nr:uncharacterized protein TM35_000352110 [Trypanosoma theileri]ORC85467.1 hypothetical protein TM35_000352110 [Trypanosoma theileri]
MMPTLQPLECDVIVPSRFSAVRPRTWNLVMDDTGRALAERYGSDMSFNQITDEAALRNRDRRMREEVLRRRSTLSPGMREESLHDTYSVAKQDTGASTGVAQSQGKQQEGESRTAAYSFLSGRITTAGESETFGQRKQQAHKQNAISYDIIPREIPVSSFH